MTLYRWKSLLIGLVTIAGIAGYGIWSSLRVKKFEMITQKSLEKVDDLIPVAIIGSGPAGLSAALYASRMNMPTVLFKGSMPGGQWMGTGDV